MAISIKYFFVAILSAQIAYGAAEFLPPIDYNGNSESDQVRLIQSLLPWSQNNSTGMITLQHQSLAALKRNFPEFEKWAQAKPDPITISISKKSSSQELSYVLRDEHFTSLNREVLESLIELIKNNPPTENADTFVKNIVDRIYQDLGNNLLSGSESIRGLITGILQSVEPQERAAIFRAGAPTTQLQMIRDLNLSEEQFKKGGFQATRFGLSPDISLQEVLRLLDAKINAHRAFLVQYGMLTVLGRMSLEAQEKLAKGELPKDVEKLLKNTDYNFLEKSESSAVIKLEFELAEKFPEQASRFSKLLSQFVAAVPKQWFQKKVVSVETEIPYLKIVEVHPYLAVYRGCIGGDCSTTRSPMFPFSPWEHDFYVMSPNNEFVGYISATRVTANGKPAFYLKDVTGRNMTADQAEAIVYAFSKAFGYYGASQYLLAGFAFTNGQNHFPVLKGKLANFNGGQITDNGPAVEMVPIDFPDEKIRSMIRNDGNFRSGYDYDIPSMHPNGAVFSARRDFFAEYNVSYRKGTLSANQPKTPRQALIFALRMLFADEKADISMIPGIIDADVRDVFAKLKNPSRYDLATYYSIITELLSRYGIELTKNFRLEYESFFLEGHLSAKDSFAAEDSAESEKYLVAYCRRVKNLIKLDQILGTWGQKIARSKKVSELIQLLKQRAEVQDVAMLSMFASSGTPDAMAALEDSRIKNRLEAMLKTYIFDGLLPNLVNTPVYSSLLKIKSATANIQSHYTVDAALKVYRENLKTIGLNYDELQNADLKRQLELTLLLANNAGYQAGYSERLKILMAEFADKHIPLNLYYPNIFIFADIQPNEFQSTGFLESRFEYLKRASSMNVDAAIEIMALAKQSTKIQALLKSRKFTPAILSLLTDYIQGNDLGERREALQISQNASGQNTFARIVHGYQYFGSNGFGEPNLTILADQIGLTYKDLLSIPRIRAQHYQALMNFSGNYQVNKNEPESIKRHAFVMSYWAETLLSGDYNWVRHPMYYNREIQSSKEYQKAYNKIVQAANAGSANALNAIQTLMLDEGVFDLTFLSDPILKRMTQSSYQYLRGFAQAELSRRNIALQIDQNLFLADLSAIYNLSAYIQEGYKNSIQYRYVHEMTDVLIKNIPTDPAARRQVLHYFVHLTSLTGSTMFSFKASLIYLAVGGQLTDSLRAHLKNRLSLIEGELSATPYGQRLLALYRSLTKSSTSGKKLMCVTLFKNREW